MTGKPKSKMTKETQVKAIASSAEQQSADHGFLRALVPGAAAFAIALLAAVFALLAGSAAPAAASGECPNEARREEQGASGRALPECRAYELVTPPYIPSPDWPRSTNGHPWLNGAEEFSFSLPPGSPAHAAVDGNAMAFASIEASNQSPVFYDKLSQRGPSGWSAEGIMPPQSLQGFLCAGSMGIEGFSQNLEKIVILDGDSENVTGGTPIDVEVCGHDEPRLVPGEPEESANLFIRDTASRSFQLVNVTPPGAASYKPRVGAVSSDGSHVVFETKSQLTPEALVSTPLGGGLNIYVWSAGRVRYLPILPSGMAALGAPAGGDKTHVLSDNGERVYFNSHGSLYLRENAGQQQSALLDGGALGTGTLTAGSSQVTSLQAILAEGNGALEEGSDQVTLLTTALGRFAVGQPISGQGIPAGTTVTAVSGLTLTLSAAATESRSLAQLSSVSEGPQPFAVGQEILGKGIPAGTTITEAKAGELELSRPATAGGTAIALESSSECTESQRACTIQIDVPEEGASGSPGEGHYRWASADGSKVFFTDVEKLTLGSTAEPGEPDLYRYDLEEPAGQRLTDLTVSAAEPADVQGVAGASEDGSYVYFVAQGVLTGAQQNSHGAAALAPAQGTGQLVGPATGHGTFTVGSTQVTSVTGGPFALGEVVSSGTRLSPETTIAACTPRCSAPTGLTLSSPATRGGLNVAFEGQGSSEVTGFSATSGAFHPGMAISGTGIPAETWIKALGAGTLTLSRTASASGTSSLTATASNLYLSRAGATTFIASLNADQVDHCDWVAGCLTSRVSPDGTFIAFNSESQLTAYDSRPVHESACQFVANPAEPGSLCPEIFRYAAESGSQGELTCASCDPTGSPPDAEFAWSMIRLPSGDQPLHGVSNSGQVFFDTMDTLSPADENHNTDVYEYTGGEGAGAGLHLISSGRDEEPSYLYDATPSGSDVFFTTAQPLLRSDTRVGYDAYDARVGGGFAEPLTPKCELEGCRPAYPVAPEGGSPGSAHNENPGNVHEKPCPKGKVRRHGRCVKKHKQHRRHRRHHHRARHNRRAGK